MNTFWKAVLRKAIAKLLGLNWADVQDVVRALMDSTLSGPEKRILALQQLKFAGVNVATWLLSAAIEVAYGEQRERMDATYPD